MKSSTDIWFCAFLEMRGVSLEKHETIERGKVRCFFVLTDEQWNEYRKEYYNSEISKFRNRLERIKDLSF